MKFVLILALAGALAGCEKIDSHWEPELVRLGMASPERPEPARPAGCVPLDPSISAEAENATSIKLIRNGGTETLSAALMASEARKNHQLKAAIKAYRACQQDPDEHESKHNAKADRAGNG